MWFFPDTGPCSREENRFILSCTYAYFRVRDRSKPAKTSEEALDNLPWNFAPVRDISKKSSLTVKVPTST
jgi:hypothetical protein